MPKNMMEKILKFIVQNKDCGIWQEKTVYTIRQDSSSGYSEGLEIPSTLFDFLMKKGFLKQNSYIGFKPIRIFDRMKVLPIYETNELLKEYKEFVLKSRENLERTASTLNNILDKNLLRGSKKDSLDNINKDLGVSIEMFTKKYHDLSDPMAFMKINGIEFPAILGPRFTKREIKERILIAIKNIEKILKDEYLNQPAYFSYY